MDIFQDALLTIVDLLDTRETENEAHEQEIDLLHDGETEITAHGQVQVTRGFPKGW